MAKCGPSRLRPLMFWLMPITRSPAQKPACKDLERNGQSPAITLKATYVLAYAHNALPGAGICV
ncbi:Malolactic regulator [Lacticaseibacillus rhamnosus]|nr:Malolactic regulator [Lacticaseibacillus rhamnosus]MCT3143565.1 Malolactic regulator [Lacticaseibacillus rhamnosus]MCT3160473.1 Malolactic regulator [Lacticaseibacillus rhamnosus]MCT3164742.1 Malolactic regulator [Lacticaseibacillus rhamnosus]MCT3174946.1 Malolactic regulator [Lacticaseibacillus rhamnosus]